MSLRALQLGLGGGAGTARIAIVGPYGRPGFWSFVHDYLDHLVRLAGAWREGDFAALRPL